MHKKSRQSPRATAARALFLERLEERATPATLSFLGGPTFEGDSFTAGGWNAGEWRTVAPTININVWQNVMHRYSGNVLITPTSFFQSQLNSEIEIQPTSGEQIGDPVGVRIRLFASSTSSIPTGPSPFTGKSFSASATFGTHALPALERTGSYGSDSVEATAELEFRIGDRIPVSWLMRGEVSVQPQYVGLEGFGFPFNADGLSGNIQGTVSIVPPTDVDVTSLAWHAQPVTTQAEATAVSGTGIDVDYSVKSGALLTEFPIKLYWSDQQTFTAEGPHTVLAATFSANQAIGNYSKQIRAADFLSSPGSWTKYLVVVADPDKLVKETNEENNAKALASDFAAITSPVINKNGAQVLSVQAFPVGPTMEATFRPAGGALNVQQAALIGGVDHFNWIQHFTESPPGVVFAYFAAGTPATRASKPWGTFVRTIGNGPFGLLDPDTSYPQRVGLYYPGANIEIDNANLIAFDEGFVPDAYPFYENEPSTGTAAPVLEFLDTPKFGPDYFKSGGDFGFSTRLVGVVGTSSVDVPGQKAAFRWWTNSAKASAGVFFRNTGLDREVDSGGITAVEYEDSPRNTRPTLSVTGAKQAVRGTWFQIQAAALDQDSDQSAYFSLESSPDGMFMDQVSGDIWWFVPADFPLGEVVVKVHVVDTGSPSLGSTTPLVLTVVENRAPVVVEITGNSVRENSPGAIVGTIIVADEPGDYHYFVVSDSRFEIFGDVLKLSSDQSLSFSERNVALSITAVDLLGLESDPFNVIVNVRLGSESAPWHNGMTRGNVDRVDGVDAADVLWTLYYFTLFSDGVLPSPPLDDDYPLVDVNGDNQIDPQDILYALYDLEPIPNSGSPQGESNKYSLDGEAVDTSISAALYLFGPVPDKMKERRSLNTSNPRLFNGSEYGWYPI